jgi:hypothetical protein
MTIIGWIICSLLLIGYFSFVIWALVLEMDILTQVNSRLSHDKQFPLVGNHRTWELWREYKILFPGGRLHSQSTRLWVAGFLCFLGAILTFYWFHLSVQVK